ncbi:TPA: DJ-1/PfpI family protein [Serratia rubidaea]|uniref:DJ-1/PfpI family protein n=1 Tax=Serratia rubidaea TaxID=61652 RepID=UPI0023B0FE03|nr:DJ-1/PfpI family protein [Serratia rubidaea]MDK1705108.1 DJ-1/PfpI family protein [Serratia rubidaea]HDJ1439241.1 DJ-1/PfpI family protein [Serratia rubidaea]HDJ1449778.1 DJ-1/PfpI family protein [Serratia rubidaea]HDJ1462241.1 DJ-1/PfpI family protein [Serratia rubidaea]HDJ2772535.1 DJ-1/PfpI family protein [Serratia rubidaea]
MTKQSENKVSDEQQPATGHTRRDVLRLGSLASLGAIMGSGALLSLPAAAQTPADRQAGGNEAGSMAPDQPLNIVMAVYQGGTLLDFAGPSEVFHRLPNTNVRYASLNGGPVTLEFGVVYGETERLADIDRADLLLVPGGPDLSEPTKPEYLAQIKRLAEGAQHITSVCTGSLVLAAAGVLKGKRSACHWAFVNDLADYGAIPDPARFVEDDNGRFMSGGGVTSGIDFALRVAAKLRGRLNAEFAQLIIEYDPDPPFRAGHPRVAPPEVMALAKKKMPDGLKGLQKIPGVI